MHRHRNVFGITSSTHRQIARAEQACTHLLTTSGPIEGFRPAPSMGSTFRAIGQSPTRNARYRFRDRKGPSPSAAWHSKRRAQTESHSAPTPSERVTGRLAVRLALQAVENRVHLSEPASQRRSGKRGGLTQFDSYTRA